MSIRAIASALDLMPPGVSPKARLVAVAVADTVNDEQGYGYPSVETLARRAGLSRTSIFRALNELEAAGVLRRVQRFSEGRKTTSAYLWDLWITLPHRDR